MLVNSLETSIKLLGLGDDSRDERFLASGSGTTLAGLLALSLGAGGLGLGGSLSLGSDGLGLLSLSNGLRDKLLVLTLLPLSRGLSGCGSGGSLESIDLGVDVELVLGLEPVRERFTS